MQIDFRPPPGYSVETEIARTQNSIIYRGRHGDSGADVVLKLTQNDVCGREELGHLETITKSGAKHVVRIFACYEDGLNLWLVLEPFSLTISDLDHRQVTPLALMNVALGSAKGLAEMACLGLADDDVKPDNIAFKIDSGRVAHIDIGGVRRLGEKPRVSTPAFMAPELQDGISSDTSPCYGWAKSMVWLVTGKDNLDAGLPLEDVVPWVGKSFSVLIGKCLAPDHTARPTPTELYRGVRELVARRTTCATCGAKCFHDGRCRICLSRHD